MEKVNLMDYLIKKTATNLQLDEKIVEKVIRHQWKNAYTMANTKDQIEITDIGYFFSSPQKIKARIERHLLALKNIDALLQGELEEAKRQKYEGYKNVTQEQIDHLNRRLKFHEDRLERTRTRSLQQSSRKSMDKRTSESPLQ